MARVLYFLEACPDCVKIKLALAIEGLDYQPVAIDPLDRSQVRAASGQDEVPVLVEEDGTALCDANRILRHLAGRPGSKLLPEGRRDQELAWILVEHAARVIGPLCERLATSREGNEAHALELRCAEEMSALEGLLDRGPYLFGDRPTVADVAVFACVSRLGRARAEPVPRALVRTAAWYRRFEKADPPALS